MDLKTILLLLCSIILCSCKPPLVSFFPQRDNGMEKSLAKENHFSAEDVYADVCSQKANFPLGKQPTSCRLSLIPCNRQTVGYSKPRVFTPIF